MTGAVANRAALLAFVGTQILPHEAGLRQWLTRLGVKTDERDDIIQEVYCRLLRLERFDHIEDPRAYLFHSARNIVLQQVRRNRVVSIMTVQNLDELGVADRRPSPETQTSARHELTQVLGLIGGLPERCRQVFELRKVHGLSQAETAKALRISENIVEKETAKGLTLILRTLAEQSAGLQMVRPRRLPRQETRNALGALDVAD
ncbi:MAG TPA: sigma-70 family RNA polymerase sigma factor [Asticcacaulis sp.]|nr:sigma-70 family RNA polymerase sigma factor [Asticcacaulis sp.]